jgi:hypothetical protein
MRYLFLLLLLPFLIASDYYVDTTGGLDTNNGTTTGSAWKTFDKVSSSTFNPGDTISFKCGETFPLSISKYVTLNNVTNITFNSYGVGDKPKIQELMDIHGAGEWTDNGNNIWYKKVWCGNRVILSGTEYYPSKTNETGITSERRFYVKSGNPTTLYVYSTQDPDTEYSSIQILQSSYIFRLINSTNINFNGLDLRGGMTSTIGIYGNSNTINIANSKISYWGTHGIDVYGYINANTDRVHHVNITNNDIDSMMGAIYPTDGYDSDDLLVQDAIDLRQAASDCLISGNTFDGNPHDSVTLESFGATDYYGVRNNTVEDNLITNTINCAYSRGISISGKDGYVTGNIVRRNYITGQNIRSQFGGNNNSIYCNIWTNGTTSPRLPSSSQHVHLNAYGGTYAITCHDNLFAFNVLDNSYLTSMEVWGQNGYENYNNTVANNIFLNGNSTGNNVQIREFNQPFTYGNLYKNNLVYSPASSNTIIVNATTYNITGANTVSGWTNNISSDPLLTSTYRLKPGSPAINAGVDVGVIDDYLGNRRQRPPSMGALEYENFVNNSAIPINFNGTHIRIHYKGVE